MSTVRRRRLLGRNYSMATRQRVWAAPEGLEVEEIDHFEVSVKRVLYEDVLLVTHHRQRRVLMLVLMGVMTAFFLGMALLMMAIPGSEEAEVIAVIVFVVLGAASGIPFLMRLLTPTEVVTVYGRRAKATISFPWSRTRALQAFRDICGDVQRAQRVVAAANAAAAPPPLDEPPLPPPDQPPAEPDPSKI